MNKEIYKQRQKAIFWLFFKFQEDPAKVPELQTREAL